MAIANLIRLAVWRTLLGDSYNAKLVCFGEGTMKLCTHEKTVFFLPVNILTVWSPAFLATRPTTVCLNTSFLNETHV